MNHGSYVLVLHLAEPLADLAVGRLGRYPFAAGYYLYVGSAFGPGGLPARLAHHQRAHKARPHWHIDYLRAHTQLRAIWAAPGPERMECRWCRILAAQPGLTAPVRGFGSRDTGCVAHLFFTPEPPTLALLSDAGAGVQIIDTCQA